MPEGERARLLPVYIGRRSLNADDRTKPAVSESAVSKNTVLNNTKET